MKDRVGVLKIEKIEIIKIHKDLILKVYFIFRAWTKACSKHSQSMRFKFDELLGPRVGNYWDHHLGPPVWEFWTFQSFQAHVSQFVQFFDVSDVPLCWSTISSWFFLSTMFICEVVVTPISNFVGSFLNGLDKSYYDYTEIS